MIGNDSVNQHPRLSCPPSAVIPSFIDDAYISYHVLRTLTLWVDLRMSAGGFHVGAQKWLVVLVKLAINRHRWRAGKVLYISYQCVFT